MTDNLGDNLGNELESLERELLDVHTRHDRALLEALLTNEFREFGSSGRSFTREEIIAELLNEGWHRSIELSEFKCQQLSEAVALVTYRTESRGVTAHADDARAQGPQAGGSATAESLRCSVWILRDGRWQMLFHQGTRMSQVTS